MSTVLATRNEFGAQQQTTALVETASTAVAAQSKAMVEARYIMAMQRPRNWDQVRQNLITECKRPSFAHNKSAYYRKPIGKGVEGLGIRFVEVALRCMTNVLVETTMIFEDDVKEVHRVSVTDLESNLTYPLDVRVSKTVERSKPMDDGSYISVRTNSYNKLTYTVPANDDDLLNKRAAQISKAIRTLGLRIIPGDLQDEAEEIIKMVRHDENAKDPDRARKKMVDAFGSLGVKASDLVEYLGHPLDTCSPQEMADMFALYGAIKDGEATWKQVMENKAEQVGGAEGGTSSAAESAPATGKVIPVCGAEEFEKKKAGWRKQIVEKTKTPSELITTIETRSRLTDEQRFEIESWSHEND
ncbi:TPA: hypothetical protein VDB83_001207 [Burkholderia cenocepacia]|uniref:hypothetical protein n=1 Tax=Burkholderia cenocepacia TaxID=95486 RepID=UPI001B9D9A89|nr:hypothetical protein [Burkholderia cenocepacia]MBR8096367.1 hypothetical protein [Burkholderia cenocepacia]HEP6426936.1 hypothetical protein [Burkholderia cenocepacia]